MFYDSCGFGFRFPFLSIRYPILKRPWGGGGVKLICDIMLFLRFVYCC